jgi:hypothetical protein
MLAKTLFTCWLVLFTLTARTAEPEQTLPVTLRVLNFDQKLKSFLLSGEFSNTLAKPLQAWRGELRLKNTGSGEVISFFFEHQSKRLIEPGDIGVWSFWMDFKPQVPEHVALKQLTTDTVTAELRLTQVLYADGTQEAF